MSLWEARKVDFVYFQVHSLNPIYHTCRMARITNDQDLYDQNREFSKPTVLVFGKDPIPESVGSLIQSITAIFRCTA